MALIINDDICVFIHADFRERDIYVRIYFKIFSASYELIYATPPIESY